MKPFVIGFYGESDTGKTTLIVDIITRLTKEDFKVASVKITNKKVSIDSEGKDTWKHASAGSQLVVFSTDVETDFILKQKLGNKEMMEFIKYFGNYDIIIIEGVNDEEIPKIRIGKIKERKNTILTYDDDFEKLIEYIKNEIDRRN
jgi:molybdopterin-guanine dinucleotide biosynthesis protein B